jgi:outer membrane protein TolC
MPHGLAARRVESRQAAGGAELASWWTGFADPQLSRYVELALEQNLDLAQAAARVAQARRPWRGRCGLAAFRQCRPGGAGLPVG